MKKILWITAFVVLVLILVFAILLLSFESKKARVMPITNSAMLRFHVSASEPVEHGKGLFLTAYPATVKYRESRNKSKYWRYYDRKIDDDRDEPKRIKHHRHFD